MSPRTLRILRVVIPLFVLLGGALATRAIGDEKPTDTGVATSSTDCVEGDVARIAVGDLPPEAIVTLGLIASGGPYPYEQDDATFQNRESRLPSQRRGYYHEYTVETPGSDDRGARRIVVGECGDRWYTDDHYNSFALIDGEP